MGLVSEDKRQEEKKPKDPMIQDNLLWSTTNNFVEKTFSGIEPVPSGSAYPKPPI